MVVLYSISSVVSNASAAVSPVIPEIPWTHVFLILCAYGIVLWPSGWIIGRYIKPLRKECEPATDPTFSSIKNAGRWIGYFERVLILTFVFLGQFTAIGFLVTAKSILRFEATRVEGEYILLGTLSSFTIAILVGIMTDVLTMYF